MTNFKRIKPLLFSLFLFTSLLPSKSQAQDYSPPAEISQTIANPVFIGEANLTVYMFFNVYDASLWATKKPWDINQKFALSLIYNRQISQQEFIDTSIVEMSRYEDISAQEAAYRESLKAILPDVKVGDRITAVYEPGEQLEFFHNGQSIGRLKDAAFAKRYIEIWLHPNAYYAQFKRSLIGMEQ